MSPKEFNSQFKRLSDKFPRDFASIHRRDQVSAAVGRLPLEWFRAVIDRIILTNNPRFDIDAAAKGERLAAQAAARAKAASQEHDSLWRNSSEEGLTETLNKFGATSVWEAIEKAKKGNAS